MQSCLNLLWAPRTERRGFRRRLGESCQVQFGNEPLSERVHVVHAVGSVVNLLQEVFQLLDENTLLEPLHWTKTRAHVMVWFSYMKSMTEKASIKNTKTNSSWKIKHKWFILQPKLPLVLSAGCLKQQRNRVPVTVRLRHERMVEVCTWLPLWLCFGGRWVACPTFPGSAWGGGKSSRNLKRKAEWGLMTC